MANPVIILGAGASYDYSPHAQPAPLMKDLVSQAFLHGPSFTEYPEAAALLSDVTYPVLKLQRNFEDVLQSIKEDAGNHPHRKAQFVALEFYFQNLFREISTRAHPINNYQTLISKINDFNQGKAHIITFNYDTLFEQSAGVGMWQEINAYTRNELKLIKLHGSHDWVYISDRGDLDYQWRGYANDFDFYKNNPDHLDHLRQKNVYPHHIREIEKVEARGIMLAKFPAIAVPLPGKQHFVCPPRHIDELKNALQRTDRMLVVGWRAGDTHLIDLLEENIIRNVRVTIVSSDAESAENVKKNLSRVKKLDFKLVGGGFSYFVNSASVKEFFMEALI